jgi:type I restriction-modification system DNA methylase subunit
VNILGYKLFPEPDYNIVTEQKNVTNAKKSDGAILVNGNVRAVIELKDTRTTNLKNAVNQAFDYKENQPDAIYVIVSNFEKLRFYIDNKVKYIEWNLFTLTEEQFGVLWLCLAYENLTEDLPKQLKTETISREDEITQKFYEHYSQFKDALFNELIANNPNIDKLTLFKYAQKILDRLIYILFAENCGLLPPNTMAKIIREWKTFEEADEYRPLYVHFQKYFRYLDSGGKGNNRAIFGYNGGLFQPDEKLDHIVVPDLVLYNRLETLRQYNYKSDVDVNILGRIFENSLTEIEKIKYELTDIESYDIPKENKRKRDGIFYTPRYITSYIVENTIGKLCNEKKIELKIDDWEQFVCETKIQPKRSKSKSASSPTSEFLSRLEKYRNWLLSLTICDPACGSGAFLNAALDFLKEEHDFIDQITASVHGHNIVFSDYETAILEKNLFGVDINEESIEITRLALWLHTAKPNHKLNFLDNNIKCGNSLISDSKISGEKAFDWHKEFPHVFANGGFDVVVGNPPYVFTRGGQFSEQEKEYYYQHYSLSHYQLNTYLLFIDRAYNHLLRQNGEFGFIVPNNCLTIDSFQPFRKFLLETVGYISIVNIFGNVFEEAHVNNCILTFTKTNAEMITLAEMDGENLNTVGTFPVKDFAHEQCIINIAMVKRPEIATLMEKIEKEKTTLGNVSEIKSGLQAYEVGKGNPPQTGEMKDRRIYHSQKQLSEDYYRYLNGKDVQRYCLNWNGTWLKYGNNLASPRTKRIFVEPRILVRQIPSKQPYCINATFTKELILNDRNSNNVLDFQLEPLYLLSILNSRLMSFWFVNKFDKFQRGIFPQFKVKELALFPIPICNKQKQKTLIALADKMLAFNTDYQNRHQRFLRRLSDNFIRIRITETLKRFDKMEFKQLLAELRKQKIKVFFNKQDELEAYFIDYRTQCQNLSQQIATTDQQIDKLVYKLYDLTDEEIQIIETD